MPETPAEVLEALTLLEVARDLGAHLRASLAAEHSEQNRRKGQTFHVFVRESLSPRLLKATKDLLPFGVAQRQSQSVSLSMRTRMPVRA